MCTLFLHKVKLQKQTNGSSETGASRNMGRVEQVWGTKSERMQDRTAKDRRNRLSVVVNHRNFSGSSRLRQFAQLRAALG